MSKSKTLKFTVKKSLVVGTATATLGAAGCGFFQSEVISNPVPQRDVQDAGDTASSEAGTDADGPSDTAESDGASDATEKDGTDEDAGDGS